MRMLIMMMLLVGCGHTRYVHVDKTNMARFRHDQKVITGNTQLEILEKFGTPDEIVHKSYMSKGVVAWLYYRKIFCSETYCYVYFDATKRVMMTHAIRMEFDPTLMDLN